MANIISFTVENFRSYKKMTTFSFEAVDVSNMEGNYHVVKLKNGKQICLLNTAVLYGANAAGKSNVIVALWALFSFVKSSRNSDPGNTIRYEPYMLSKETRNRPIYFSIRFIAEGIVYDYKYSYNETLFLNEELKETMTDSIIFKRGSDGVVRFHQDSNICMHNETYLKNHLALSELSMKQNSVIQAVYKELTSMRIIPITTKYHPTSNLTNDVATMILNKGARSKFSSMLKYLILSSDTGIKDFSVEKLDDDKFIFPESVSESAKRKFIKEYQYSISMLHSTEDGSDILLPFDVESLGTQTLFKAGALVIKSLEEGTILAYDEMNIALHPMLFRRLVELFNNKATNPHGAQLLITTHDTVLIDTELLRADQIWFVEKIGGASNLYSAIDFDDVTIDQPFGPWYKAGRLGGRPKLKPYPNRPKR